VPRIRSVKPEYWSDFGTARLSRDARLLYVALWNLSDEHGRLHGDPRFVKGHAFPYDDDLTAEDVDHLLQELEANSNVHRYEVTGEPYLFLPTLHKHQRLEPTKVDSRLPAPPGNGPDPEGPPPAHPDEHARRAGKSAPGADRPETNAALQVAGSREHGAGSNNNARGARADSDKPPPQRFVPAAELPGELVILRDKLGQANLAARWDRLTPDVATELVELQRKHGDTRLITAAQQSWRPDSRPQFAQVWLGTWRALPEPGALRLVEPDCPRHQQPQPCSGCAADLLAGEEGTA